MRGRRARDLLLRKQPKLKRRGTLLFSAVVFSLCFVSCVKDNDLTIQMDNPIRFTVSGPSTLQYFQVSGPDIDREPNSAGDGEHLMLMKDYWKVVPDGKSPERTLDEIGPISYGDVPSGFVQVFPNTGSPPPLIDRNKYNVTISPKNGRGVNMFFLLKDGSCSSKENNKRGVVTTK